MTFDISKRTIQKKINQIDVTESRGPNGLPTAFFQKNSREINKILNKHFKNTKSSGKILDSSKTAAVTPINKSGEKQKVGNNRPVSLLDIESKIFEKCKCIGFYNNFTCYLTKHQHGFVTHKSLPLNLLSFFKKIYEALGSDPRSKIVAFYTHFSKVFDNLLHYEFIQNVAQIGLSGVYLKS